MFGFGAAGMGMGMGYPTVDPARVEEMKGAQVGRIVEQAQAMKAHLSQAQEHQVMQINARAEQEIAVLVGQVNQRREQAKMQANAGSQQQLWALDQRQATTTAQLEQQAMALATQARQQEAMRGMGGVF